MHHITPESLRPLLLHRQNDSHKHQYGRLLIIAGSASMPGAAIMATGAALRSGCGLVTLHSCRTAAQAAMVRYPSAMLSVSDHDFFCTLPENIGKYSAIAIGPGLGQAPETCAALGELMQAASSAGIPMLLDADAINILAKHPGQLEYTPAGSVFTPHKAELGRLLGSTSDQSCMDFCSRHNVSLVSKGYHTRVYGNHGDLYENTTGNPGMAKGGSGDVLTGLVAGLMARGYSGLDSSRLGVWIHGYAADILSAEFTQEAWSAQELTDRLPLGFKELYR